MKDRLFLDANVVLDLLGEKEPFYESAAKTAIFADKDEIELFVTSLRYSTSTFYFRDSRTKYWPSLVAQKSIFTFGKNLPSIKGDVGIFWFDAFTYFYLCFDSEGILDRQSEISQGY